MYIKILFLLVLINTFVQASCISKINIEFDFEKQNITVNSKIFDSQKSVQLNYDGFKLKILKN